VTPFDIGGSVAEDALGRAGITVNKNLIPYDQRTPNDPSGVRLGSPAMTTRGLGTEEFRQMTRWMVEVLRSPEDEELGRRIAGEVKAMLVDFPVPA
jgi:glycine hydroxymethyltransferase